MLARLEMYAIELALPRLKDDDFAALERLIAEMQLAIDAKDYMGYSDLQVQFHDLLRDRANNKVLRRVFQKLHKAFILRTWHTNDSRLLFALLQESNDEHRLLVKALRSKDLKKAQATVLKHWSKSMPDRG